MTGSEAWTVDGVSLNTVAYWIRTWNGMDTVPGVNTSGSSSSSGSGTNGNVQLSQVHGEFWYPKYYTAALKTVTMYVSTLDSSGNVPANVNQARQNYDANLDTLMRLFARKRNLMQVVRTLSSGSQRLGLVEVCSVIDPQLQGLADGLFTVELTLPDGFWRDPSDGTIVSGISPGFSGVVSQFASATAPMNDLEFQISGPVTNPRVTDNESGSWFQYNGSISGGTTLHVYNSTMSIANGTITNMAHGGDSNWLTLYPTAAGGGVNIAYNTGSGAGTLAIFGHKKYLR